MSIPACGWAMARGRELRLSCHLRMLLLALAERANSIGECHPSQATLADDTGLTDRGVRKLLPELAALRLIAIEAKPGTVATYRLLRHDLGTKSVTPEPCSDQPRNVVPITPAHHSRANGADPGTRVHEPRNQSARTPEPRSDKPYREPYREPKTRAYARAQREGIKSSLEGSKQAAPPPPAHDPTPAEIAAARKAEAATIAALPPELAAVISSLGHSLRGIAKPPGVVSPLDRHEQAELLRPRPKPHYLPPEVLAAQRAALANRAMVSPLMSAGPAS